MNPILNEKFNEIESANDYDCWYIVKQKAELIGVCYQVSLLKKYKENPSIQRRKKLEDFIKESAESLNRKNKELKVPKEYRILRVAAFLGLIKFNGRKYKDADLTVVFDEITNRCNKKYEKISTYEDIMERQIEKMYISSSIDEEYKGIRKEYHLFPVVFLYKVLLEIGRSTGVFSITENEYRFIVSTCTTYQDFLDALLYIKLIRKDEKAREKLEEYKKEGKFDARMGIFLKFLPTIEDKRSEFKLKEKCIDKVANKVNAFEQKLLSFDDESYINFLCSARSLFDVQQGLQNPDFSERSTNGTNVILYGVPGCGKSHMLNKEYLTDSSYSKRVVFHPDYTYSDFIGQILPKVELGEDGEKNISYGFTAGPFTSVLAYAFAHPKVDCFLVIEEINRGNAPAIFGDVFQLLDRKEKKDKENLLPINTSEYEIDNQDISLYVYNDVKHKVRIPSNMSIIATMNTSDQNVFTLDNAFQRRWHMRLVENVFSDDEDDTELRKAKIADTTVSWEKFCTSVNTIILKNSDLMPSTEDKRLGVHFVNIYDLSNDESSLRAFPEKVFKYLWDDAFKYSHENFFNSECQSLENVVRMYMNASGDARFNVLNEKVKSCLFN